MTGPDAAPAVAETHSAVASDATPEIAAAMAATESPWPSAHTVDMTHGPAAGLAAAMAAVRVSSPS